MKALTEYFQKLFSASRLQIRSELLTMYREWFLRKLVDGLIQNRKKNIKFKYSY